MIHFPVEMFVFVGLVGKGSKWLGGKGWLPPKESGMPFKSRGKAGVLGTDGQPDIAPDGTKLSAAEKAFIMKEEADMKAREMGGKLKKEGSNSRNLKLEPQTLKTDRGNLDFSEDQKAFRSQNTGEYISGFRVKGKYRDPVTGKTRQVDKVMTKKEADSYLRYVGGEPVPITKPQAQTAILKEVLDSVRVSRPQRGKDLRTITRGGEVIGYIRGRESVLDAKKEFIDHTKRGGDKRAKEILLSRMKPDLFDDAKWLDDGSTNNGWVNGKTYDY
jgi:hypothetical protein